MTHLLFIQPGSWGILSQGESTFLFFFFLNIFIDYAITVVPFPPEKALFLRNDKSVIGFLMILLLG